MGKKLIIKGADFYANRIEQVGPTPGGQWIRITNADSRVTFGNGYFNADGKLIDVSTISVSGVDLTGDLVGATKVRFVATGKGDQPNYVTCFNGAPYGENTFIGRSDDIAWADYTFVPLNTELHLKPNTSGLAFISKNIVEVDVSFRYDFHESFTVEFWVPA